MLDKDTKAELINLTIAYEMEAYPKGDVCFYIDLLRALDDNTRTNILDFLRNSGDNTFKMYCEIMRYLPSVENEKGFISYII